MLPRTATTHHSATAPSSQASGGPIRLGRRSSHMSRISASAIPGAKNMKQLSSE
jgi:hypothetical protein